MEKYVEVGEESLDIPMSGVERLGPSVSRETLVGLQAGTDLTVRSKAWTRRSTHIRAAD